MHTTDFGIFKYQVNIIPKPPIVNKSLVSMLCLLYYYLSVCLFIFSHVVVSLFSFYEFDSPSGIFRPSFEDRVALVADKIVSYNLERGCIDQLEVHAI